MKAPLSSWEDSVFVRAVNCEMKSNHWVSDSQLDSTDRVFWRAQRKQEQISQIASLLDKKNDAWFTVRRLAELCLEPAFKYFESTRLWLELFLRAEGLILTTSPGTEVPPNGLSAWKVYWAQIQPHLRFHRLFLTQLDFKSRERETVRRLTWARSEPEIQALMVYAFKYLEWKRFEKAVERIEWQNPDCDLIALLTIDINQRDTLNEKTIPGSRSKTVVILEAQEAKLL